MDVAAVRELSSLLHGAADVVINCGKTMLLLRTCAPEHYLLRPTLPSPKLEVHLLPR